MSQTIENTHPHCHTHSIIVFFALKPVFLLFLSLNDSVSANHVPSSVSLISSVSSLIASPCRLVPAFVFPSHSPPSVSPSSYLSLLECLFVFMQLEPRDARALVWRRRTRPPLPAPVPRAAAQQQLSTVEAGDLGLRLTPALLTSVPPYQHTSASGTKRAEHASPPNPAPQSPAGLSLGSEALDNPAWYLRLIVFTVISGITIAQISFCSLLFKINVHVSVPVNLKACPTQGTSIGPLSEQYVAANLNFSVSMSDVIKRTKLSGPVGFTLWSSCNFVQQNQASPL